MQGMMKTGMAEAIAKSMLAANPKYLESFLSTIDTKYGSMKQFLETEMELTPEKIAQLKSHYLQ